MRVCCFDIVAYLSTPRPALVDCLSKDPRRFVLDFFIALTMVVDCLLIGGLGGPPK